MNREEAIEEMAWLNLPSREIERVIKIIEGCTADPRKNKRLTIRQYAHAEGISTQAVYSRITAKKIKATVCDCGQGLLIDPSQLTKKK